MTNLAKPQEYSASGYSSAWQARRERWIRGRRRVWAWVCRRSLDKRLWLAVDVGDWTWAEDLLAREADIDFAPIKCNIDGLHKRQYSLQNARTRMTALHRACLRGDFEAANWLLEHGADRKVYDTWGTVPVQLAAEQEFLDLVALFAAYGDPLDHRMAVYTTFAIDWTPNTVREHVEKLGCVNLKKVV